tara:strand:- start:168 stop:431 length:264 start_codon:yes stop_codon:yes gene_type:complete
LSYGPHTVTGSLFHRTEIAMVSFCHNLFISNAIGQCVDSLSEAQEEYSLAVLSGDEKEIASAKLKLSTYQSSLVLAAYMFDEDGIST